jgi:peptide chain release factor subunit 1
LPKNGLVIYSGQVNCDETTRDKKILIDIEPLKPITSTLYKCDNQFHTELIRNGLDLYEKKFGFIIVDGKGALFGILSGNNREVIKHFTVDLPPKHRFNKNILALQ